MHLLVPALFAASGAQAAPAMAGSLPLPPIPPPRLPGPLVLIDPGHGGKDPGAIGRSGVYEKNVTLATALELRRLLAAAGYRVQMTRASDVFVPLQERVAMAERLGPALFLSLHADKMDDAGVRGASVYTLAGAASDPQTERLASRENAARDDWVAQDGGQLSSLASLSVVRARAHAGSDRLAGNLVAQLHRDLPVLRHPLRHASFVVLRAADIPSALVEMGFLSNAADEAGLRRPEGRQRIAAAVKRAVDAYFSKVPGRMMTAGRMAGSASLP